MKKQQGFTLIELIVVIVILGILAATALPRFIDVQTQARIASVNGVAGGLRSGISLVRSQYMINGSNAATTVTMADGQIVTVAAISGIPVATAAGIGAVLQGTAGTLDGYTITYGAPTTFVPNNGGSTTCRARYDATTGNVATDVGGC